MGDIITTGGIGNIYNNTAISGGGANMAAMSPDALMAFLQTQLSGTDDQMNKIEGNMTQQQNTGDALNSLMDQLNKYPCGINSGDAGSTTLTPDQVNQYRNDTDTTFNAAIDAAGGPNTTAGAQLMKSKGQFDSTFGSASLTDEHPTDTTGASPDNDLSVNDINTIVQGVKNTQAGMNSDSQMGMINLQSLMSARQTFIQLATNLMQGLNDATKSIATNVGH